MKVNTKTGDVFCVELENKRKRYFQYIANDLTQLNSDVIRVFNKIYAIDDNPDLVDIIRDGIELYCHTVTKLGIKMSLWKQVGNNSNIGDLDHIIFRDTGDYGTKIGERPIEISNKWFIWRINDSFFTTIGSLGNIKEKTYIGLVINPYGIIELLKGNKYPIAYPK